MQQHFWQQADEEVFNIIQDHLKLIVLDAYLFNTDFTKKQKAKIIRILTSLARQNCPLALNRLGLVYFDSIIVKENRQRAEKYWQQAAALGDDRCLCELGHLYEEKAKTAPTAYQQAFAYHTQAASLGNANRHGQGVAKDLAKAIDCFQRAIALEKDNPKLRFDGLFYNPIAPKAAFNLSNEEQGIYWLLIAEKLDEPRAKFVAQGLRSMQANNDNQQTNNPMEFWQSTAKPSSETKSRPELLRELANILELNPSWKTGKNGEVWSYLTPDEAIKLTCYSFAAMSLQKTKEDKYILLIKDASVITL